MKKNGPFKIGLTGGIGAGKSQVLGFLRQMGIPVLQADEIGHHLLQKKSFSKKLTGLFGRGIIRSGGRIHRARLAQEVFSKPSQRLKLNRLMHPAIWWEVNEWFKNQANSPHSKQMVVVEVPLLFEGGFNRWFDGVLCISSSRAIRHKRLRQRGWNAKEIRRRELAQWVQKRKNAASDWVIYNHGSRKRLKYAVRRWFKMVQRRFPINGANFSRPMKIAKKG